MALAKTLRIHHTTVAPKGYSKSHKHEWEHGFYFLSGVGLIEVGDEKANVAAGTMALNLNNSE